MRTSSHGRRLDNLERSAPVKVTPEVRACAKRIAHRYKIGIDELLVEAERVVGGYGPDAPLEQVAADIAADLGITVEELMRITPQTE